MAIIIQNLTPQNPSTPAGGGVTFNVSAFDDGGATLTYQWQFSTDGINYTGAGLTNNTSTSYDTGPLTINQNGIYYRVAVSNGTATLFSNEYPGIGDRIVSVFQDPSIITFVDETVDYYPTSEGKSVGQTFEIVVSSTLDNANISNTTLVSNINFQWQVSTDSGNSWTNIVAGGNITITNTNAPVTGISPTIFMKYSSLRISNLTFASNLNQYRAIISYTGAVNTPVTLAPVLLLIDPQINIYQQPGTGTNDTIQTNCYKTSIPNSGRITVQVAALTTATTQLNYQWQVNFGNDTWVNIEEAVNLFVCRLVSGTSSNTDLLQLERFIYYDNLSFRCVVSGVSGEASLTSNSHRVFMTDVQVKPTLDTTVYNINEDRYGDILNRDVFVNDTIQNIVLTGSINIARNTGINGNRRVIWERKNPGSSVWNEIGSATVINTSTNLDAYTQFPTNTSDNVDLTYITPPLRVSVDNGAKYRIKVESSAIYTLSGNPKTKTITPYYSDEITVNVYRTVYITNQPAASDVFPNTSASFSVTAIPSSGNSSDITYRWQYNTENTTTGWINVPNSSPYSGVTTDLLVISPVTANPTYDWYRCVVSITGQLSSVTSNAARLTTKKDLFTSVSTLNDIIAREFDNVTFEIFATTLSAGTISYQWQKSTNYDIATASGTWTNIVGQTTNTLNLLSITQNDAAFYRVRMTSLGGEVQFSNVARVFFQPVKIYLLQDIVSSLTVLEGQQAAYTFVCNGVSSLDTEVSFQWQIKRSGDTVFSDIGNGFNNSTDESNTYVLRALDTIADNNAKIRCKLSAPEIPNDVFTRECTVTVIRRFTYFADVATKQVTLGSTLTLDLNPSFTGGSPSYMWQRNGVDLGETQDTLVIPNIDSSYNGSVYRCRITLDSCTQHQYSRNNTVTTVTVTPPSVFTLSITISTVSAPSIPTYYSNETAKTGAAIGTVICIPKPAGYIEDASATDDDRGRWGCSQSGTAGNTTAVSTVTSGSIWSSNKPSWATSYTSPKWLLRDDRFKGYIEMRGQYVKALDFPELARMYGTKFGGSITGTYPSYNTNDYFRLPNTYAKRMLGTGNVNNNSGSTSVVPLYNPDGSSGGDKNVPGSMGGVYNYERSAQLPPGSPGLTGQLDGTADGSLNAQTFSLGSFRSTGVDEVNAFAQPSFAGTVTYNAAAPVNAFTDTPTHNHTAVSIGWRSSAGIITGAGCFGRYGGLAGSTFVVSAADSGVLEESRTTTGDSHGHAIEDQGPGSFDMVRDGGMNISDTTLRFTAAARNTFDNNLRFYLRNNEAIPMNAPYFRLKYMVKAY